ncbi:MAG: hypothetical protein E7618_05310 [Ruminococcaceae bacterium]|nr:hypothetical protein [Oscillospiraceae bacterium]
MNHPKSLTNIKALTNKLLVRYNTSDLASLLLPYADKARRNIGRTLRYPDFYQAVARTVSPEKLTDPTEIAAHLKATGREFSYRELALFYDYAVLAALWSLWESEPSDRALCQTIDYLKALHSIEPEELYPLLSEAERILSTSDAFIGCDEVTQNSCRANVVAYARRFHRSESDAARILVADDPCSRPRSRASYLYLPCIWLLTVLFMLLAAYLCPNIGILLFLWLPLSETAKQITDFLFSFLVKTMPVPRKKLDNIPAEAATLTVITALLSGREDDLSLVERIRNCYFANRGEHCRFGLLCDLREADSESTPADEPSIARLSEAMAALKQAYGCELYLFVRRRRYAPTEGRYMGWERKRGAVIELTRLLQGKDTTISVICGDASTLSKVRYVITLDTDTRLYHGAVRDLVGAMLHPSNRPVVKNGIVVRGHAILQPRMEASLVSAEKTPFAVLSAGNGGTDIYASAAYETYQTLFDEGIFCGKGIFDVKQFSACIDGQFPDGTILSHDLLEGSRLRAAALTDLPLTDDLPKNPLACFDRQHRWIRGDVQALLFVGNYVPDANGKLYRNPISALSRYKILDNVRRALVPVSAVLVLLLSLFAPRILAIRSLILALSYLLLPTLLTGIRLFRFGGRRFVSYVMPGVFHALGNLLYSIASLLHTALLSADAVLRAGFRLLFSRKRMLEWKTASESEHGMAGLPLYLYRMLPSCLLGLALFLCYPGRLIRVIGLLFALFPFAAWHIGKPFRRGKRIGKHAKTAITAYASDLFRFFSEQVGEGDSYLPPDNFQLSPGEIVAHRTSPTNIGLYLLSCLAAARFGFISTGELVGRLKKTLTTIARLDTWHGHLYNWYDTKTLSVLGEPYVSTVDSGNFITCLVALRGGLSDWDDRTRRFEELDALLTELIRRADFSKLYDRKKKLFRIGIHTVHPNPNEGHYDLFMSEARTTSYYAIASGQVPREHWARLSRIPISRNGYLGFASWTGTMFEYLMPALLLPTPFGSLSYEAIAFAIREQRASTIAEVWGRSESGYYRFDADMNYQYRAFGAPSLGLKRGLHRDAVIAPYATFLCLPFCPEAALRNLYRLSDLGLYGPYGFYEALDCTPSRVGRGRAVIRSYMSHHVGMSLLACANACFDGYCVKAFMKDPHMASSAELLEEKIPVSIGIPRKTVRPPLPAPTPPLRTKPFPHAEPSPIPPDLPYTAVLAENGLCALVSGEMLRLSAMGCDLTIDPFRFGAIYRPRFFLKADGKCYDLLSGTLSRGATQSHLTWRTDTPELMADLTLSILGNCRTFLFTLSVEGQVSELCPTLCFQPSLTSGEDRMAHPAYADLLITAESCEGEGAILYTRRQKDRRQPDRSLAVSFESYGGGVAWESRRDTLGLLYDEEDLTSLVDRPLCGSEGALIHPFCVLRKVSKTNGKYRLHILLSVGHGRDHALTSLRAARATLKKARYSPAPAWRSMQRTVSEKLAGCGGEAGVPQAIERILEAMCRRPSRIPLSRTYPIGALWKYGISGDLPILSLRFEDPLSPNSPHSRHLHAFIAAHKYLALSGIRLDLVLLFDSQGAYQNPTLAVITEELERCASSYLLGHSGGVFAIDGTEDVPLLEGIATLSVVLHRDFTLASLFSDRQGQTNSLPPLCRRPETHLTASIPVHAHVVHGGFFSEDGFTALDGQQSAPWSYLYAQSHFGTLVTQHSLGYTWIGNCHERRITPFNGDYLQDFTGELLIATINGKAYDLCACASYTVFGRGSARYEGQIATFRYTVTATCDPDLPCKVVTVTFSDEPPLLTYRILPVMGDLPKASRPIETIDEDSVTRFVPRVVSEDGYDIGFLVRCDFGNTIGFLLGAYPKNGEKTLSRLREKYRTPEDFGACAARYEAHIAALLPKSVFQFPDRALEEMVSYYLPYQTLVCRFFARTGFYQSGGAYGFRDQLQDCLMLLHGAPSFVRTHILRCASHQYEEGDVMHWWHSVRGIDRGVRTRYSDDLLWLPYVVADYVTVTGDRDILDIELPYLSSHPLDKDEQDRYEQAHKSRYRESLYFHCVRAVEHALRFGKHGLPQMGGGDWNDGMNRVGENGGESVWLGMFLIMVLERMAPLAAAQGDLSGALKYRRTAEALRTACERAFQNGHYVRAYYGDGTPLGEGEAIDLLPQAFASLIGLSPQHVQSGLNQALTRLWRPDSATLLLLTPPYDRSSPKDPGYIAAYPHGLRENGGQYTHAAVWGIMGLAAAGQNDMAAEILRRINPAAIAETEADAKRYRGEPYCLAGDVSGHPAFPGRCGWSHYTGSAGWFYLAVLTSLIGLEITGDTFTVTPRLSPSFPHYSLRFVHRETEYILVARYGTANRFVLDGKNVNNLFYFDKNSHLLEIMVEKSSDLR